jgi:hypothetical protein
MHPPCLNQAGLAKKIAAREKRAEKRALAETAAEEARRELKRARGTRQISLICWSPPLPWRATSSSFCLWSICDGYDAEHEADRVVLVCRPKR